MDDNIAIKHSKSLVIPIGKTTGHIAFKFLPETILLLKVNYFDRILNRTKIDGMVNDHSSSCNS